MRTTMRALLVSAGLLCLQATVFSQQVAKTISSTSALNGIIGFLEFKPSDYGTQKHPLIIFLAGIGERGNGTTDINLVTANAIPRFCANGATMRFTAGGQTSSFVVLSPQLYTAYGSWPGFYVQEMIKYAKANLQIDTNRIYVTGLSLGGGGVWRAITNSLQDDYQIAAAAPVCGTQDINDANYCSTVGTSHMPIWAFHCMDDGTVSVNATQHAEILGNQCSPALSPASKFTYYQSGGHGGAWINAYDTGHITTIVNGGGSFTANPNLYEWLLSNRRSASGNTPPVAAAGTSQVITLPLSTITLNGTGTATNGATIASYSWVKTSGPAAGTISVPGTGITLVTGLVQGSYVFTLTVTDNHGLSSSSAVTVTVNPLLGNQPPVVNVGPGINIVLPTNSASLDGSASADPDGTIMSYSWQEVSGGAATINNSSSATASVSGLAQGNYVFSLTVTDNTGAASSGNVTVVVNPSGVVVQPIGYIKQSVGIPQACGDVSTTGRIAIYGTSIANGSIVYTDAAQTNKYNGGYNWFSYSSTSNGSVADAFSIFPDGSIHLLTSCSVNQPPAPPPVGVQPTGYIKLSVGIPQACGDASTTGRVAIYTSSIANGNIVYTDAAQTNKYNGGYNWFSYSSTSTGSVADAFSIFPDGTIHLLTSCSVGQTPPPPPPVGAQPIGYLKLSVGIPQACGDASTTGRMAIYGTSIANGSIVYTDAAQANIYNGGYNWFSYASTGGGSVTQALSVFPDGTIHLLTSCSGTAQQRTVQQATEELAALPQADAAINAAAKLSVYPNPVHTTAAVEFNSVDNGNKTIYLYNSNGILVTKYTWHTTKGYNKYSLNNLSGLSGGLYIIDIRDNNGKIFGKLKFIKM